MKFYVSDAFPVALNTSDLPDNIRGAHAFNCAKVYAPGEKAILLFRAGSLGISLRDAPDDYSVNADVHVGWYDAGGNRCGGVDGGHPTGVLRFADEYGSAPNGLVMNVTACGPHQSPVALYQLPEPVVLTGNAPQANGQYRLGAVLKFWPPNGAVQDCRYHYWMQGEAF